METKTNKKSSEALEKEQEKHNKACNILRELRKDTVSIKEQDTVGKKCEDKQNS